MKAIIEKSLEYLDSDEKDLNMFSEFNLLLQCITLAQSRLHLKLKITHVKSYFRYFEFGFERSHFWTKQKINGKTTGPRIIFVELND